MKARNFIWVVLIIALVGIGFWWFKRPTATTPEKATEAPVAAKADAPKPDAPSTQMAKPLSSVAQVKTETTNAPSPSADATPAAPDPRAELKTAMQDYARIIRSEGTMAAMIAFRNPDDLANIDPLVIQRVLAAEARFRQTANGQQMDEAEAQKYDALENQTPSYNAAGDEATYMFTYDSDIETTSGTVLHAGTQFPMVFIKINGRWYLKGSN